MELLFFETTKDTKADDDQVLKKHGRASHGKSPLAISHVELKVRRPANVEVRRGKTEQ